MPTPDELMVSLADLCEADPNFAAQLMPASRILEFALVRDAMPASLVERCRVVIRYRRAWDDQERQRGGTR